jgi:hypothetical protein
MPPCTSGRAGQRHLPAVAGDEGFLVARRVGQQIMAQRLFIALERIDLPHHPIRGQLQDITPG